MDTISKPVRKIRDIHRGTAASPVRWGIRRQFAKYFPIGLVVFALYANNLFSAIVEEIYYIVDNTLITKMDFEEEMALIKKNPEATFDKNDPVIVMSNYIITTLIENKLEEEKMGVKESDISNYINVIVEKNNLGTVENFLNLMAASEKINYEEYSRLIRRRLSYQYYTTRLVSTPPINSREVEEYYQKNRETEFKITEPIYNLSTLTLIISDTTGFSEKLTIQNRLQKIREEIVSEKISFEEGVTQYSEDEISKVTSGVMGWVTPGQLGMGVDSFKTFSKLQKGEISDLIRDNRGLSIYRVNDIVKQGYVPYDLAIREARNKLYEEKQSRAFNKSLKELYETAVIIPKKSQLTVKFIFP